MGSVEKQKSIQLCMEGLLPFPGGCLQEPEEVSLWKNSHSGEQRGLKDVLREKE